MVTALTNLVDHALVPLAVVVREPPLYHANAAFLALAGPPPWNSLEPGLARVAQEGMPGNANLGGDGAATIECSLWPLHSPGVPGSVAVLVVAAPPPAPMTATPAKAVHDLRGSLNNIGLAVELLIRAPLSPADRTARLTELRDLVEASARLLERFPSPTPRRPETV